MTREEAARILDPETSRDELWKYEADTRIEACNEACRMGADALRAQQERENPKQITNADRVRASNEKLKEWYCKNRDCGRCDFCHSFGCTLNEWLQQAAEEV